MKKPPSINDRRLRLENPIVVLGHVDHFTSRTYQTLVAWTVGLAFHKRAGELHEIRIQSTDLGDYANAEFRLRLLRPTFKITYFTDFVLVDDFHATFPTNELFRESQIILEIRSPTGVELSHFTAQIVGGEFDPVRPGELIEE